MAGLPVQFSEHLISMEEAIAKGSEERLISEEDKIVKGKITMKEFVEKNKAAWAKAS